MPESTTATSPKKRLVFVAFIVVIVTSAILAALGYHYLTYRNALMQNAVIRSGQMSVRVCVDDLELAILAEENRMILDVAVARSELLDAKRLARINQRYPMIDTLFLHPTLSSEARDNPLQAWLIRRVQQDVATRPTQPLKLRHLSGWLNDQPVQVGFVLLAGGSADSPGQYLIFTLDLHAIRTSLLSEHQQIHDHIVIRENVSSEHAGAEDPFVVEASFGQILPFWTLTSTIDNQGMTSRSRMEFVIYSTLIVFLFGLILLSVYFIWRQVHHEKKLSLVKSQMISHVSHELKTPLSLIRMYTETLLLGRVETPEKKESYYRIILGECDHLHLLINNTLDFSSIEKGMKEYHFKCGNLAEVLEHLVSQYHDYFTQQGFAVCVAIDNDIPNSFFDPLAINQVFGNLLDNAIKFSPDEKKIYLALSVKEGEMKVEVTDCGIGMRPDGVAAIFAPYTRLSSKFRGSGIGLSLVKHAVDAHGGTIQVLSKPGAGSTFIVTLPIREGADDA